MPRERRGVVMEGRMARRDEVAAGVFGGRKEGSGPLTR